MTQDEMIELAKQAGFDIDLPAYENGTALAIKLAKLVAAKALAQPEQEPVAWVSEDVCEGQYIDGRPRKIWWECEKGVGTVFYTATPQRTWVDLTRTQMQDVYFAVLEEHRGGHQMQGQLAFGEALQAKIREKNT